MPSRTRSRRHFLQRSAALASIGLLAGCGVLPSPMQQPATTRRIGYLTPGDLPLQGWEEASHDAFLQGMRDLGWVEGQNLTIEYRYGERRNDRFPASNLVTTLATNTCCFAGKMTSLVGCRGLHGGVWLS